MQLGVGLTTVSWAVYVLTMDTQLRDMPVYDELVQYVPGWAWARIAVTIGLGQAIVAGLGLRWPPATGWPRRATGMLSMLFWKIVAVSMFNSGEATPMAVVACGVALMNLPVVALPLLRRA